MRIRLQSGLIAILFCLPTAMADSPLALEVTPVFKVYQAGGPADESPESHIEWSSDNAEYVLIIGYDNEQHPAKGRIDVGGSYIFVAVNESGATARAVGAFMMGEPGPGLHGLVYRTDSSFNVSSFFRDADKYPAGQVNAEDLSRRVLLELQRLGYTVGVERPKYVEHAVLYTLNYNYSSYLNRLPSDQGEVQRQVAFVASVGPDLVNPAAKNMWLYIRPLVQVNMPRDNAKWTVDPDALQVAKNASRALADAVLNTKEASK